MSGPGKHYRDGLTLFGVMEMFPDDANRREMVRGTTLAGRHHLPELRPRPTFRRNAKHKTMRHRCRDCRKFFSVKIGTVMQSSNLGYRIWAIAIYLMHTGIKSTSSMKLHRDLGIAYTSAWHLVAPHPRDMGREEGAGEVRRAGRGR